MWVTLYPTLKRVLDAVLAIVGLIVLSPLMAAIAVLVLVKHGRPVVFSQQRPGKNGKPFTMRKFRSMRHGDEPDEERLTPFGKRLRSTSLDELPSLWSVVVGDMSLVGPRPLLMEYLPLYDERQATRHHVRPGITGLAQANGRNLVSWEDRFEMDVEYVEQMSLALDAKVLAATVKAVTQREGISAEGEATMSKFTGSPA